MPIVPSATWKAVKEWGTRVAALGVIIAGAHSAIQWHDESVRQQAQAQANQINLIATVGDHTQTLKAVATDLSQVKADVKAMAEYFGVHRRDTASASIGPRSAP